MCRSETERQVFENLWFPWSSCMPLRLQSLSQLRKHFLLPSSSMLVTGKCDYWYLKKMDIDRLEEIGVSTKYDEGLVVPVLFQRPNIIITYLLSKWESSMGKHLAQSHGVWTNAAGSVSWLSIKFLSYHHFHSENFSFTFASQNMKLTIHWKTQLGF